ncbi:polyadenylate-binding protein, partial [Ascoidea rubescens DSM 1968]
MSSSAAVEGTKTQSKPVQVTEEEKKVEVKSSPSGESSNSTNESNEGSGDKRVQLTPEEQQEIDSRSVYVGNVDYSSTPEQLEEFFHNCGVINRITILYNKYTGYPRGYAYIEFAKKESVPKALDLADQEFRGRKLIVSEKRTNVPGYARRRGGYNNASNSNPNNNGGYRRGNYRGNYRGRGILRGGYRGRSTYRGRGRGRGGYRQNRGLEHNDDSEANDNSGSGNEEV